MTEDTPQTEQTSTVIHKETAYRGSNEGVELLRADAGDIHATSVTMERSGAETIHAERVHMTQSGTRDLNTRSAIMDQSGAVMLTSERAVLAGSSSVLLTTKDAEITKSRVAVLVSEHTKVNGDLRTLVHIGNACDNVKPVFDAQGAAIFGGVVAAGLLIIGGLLRRLTGR